MIFNTPDALFRGMLRENLYMRGMYMCNKLRGPSSQYALHALGLTEESDVVVQGLVEIHDFIAFLIGKPKDKINFDGTTMFSAILTHIRERDIETINGSAYELHEAIRAVIVEMYDDWDNRHKRMDKFVEEMRTLCAASFQTPEAVLKAMIEDRTYIKGASMRALLCERYQSASAGERAIIDYTLKAVAEFKDRKRENGYPYTNKMHRLILQRADALNEGDSVSIPKDWFNSKEALDLAHEGAMEVYRNWDKRNYYMVDYAMQIRRLGIDTETNA